MREVVALTVLLLCTGCGGRTAFEPSEGGVGDSGAIDGAVDADECPIQAIGVGPGSPCLRVGLRCQYACGASTHFDLRWTAVCTATGWTTEDVEPCVDHF